MIIKTHCESRLLKRGLKQRRLINRLFISFLLASSASAAAAEEPDSIAEVETLQEVVVQSRGTRKLRYNAGNTELITAAELTRAACCNLGESFTTNPSVFIGYFLIAMPMCYLSGFSFEGGITGIWIGYPIGLTVTGLMLCCRFYYITHPKRKFFPTR